MPHRSLLIAFAASLLAALALHAQQPPTAAELMTQADKLFDEKNYKEAGDAYAASLAPGGDVELPKRWVHASERLIMSRLRMQQFDDAIAAAEGYITRSGDTAQAARAHRLTGNLYMLIPHWGTRSGGIFHRAQWKQGMQVRSWQYDKQRAVAHMEKARELYARFDQDENWRDERIDCLFDLANIYSRFGIFDSQPHFWHMAWAERNDQLAETAGEDDFDEYHNQWQWQRKRPLGLRIDAEGNPIFPTTPDVFDADLPDERKILFVLSEVRDLDITDTKKHAALSWYRQAMLARSRFGMDRLNLYASNYHANGKQPLQEQMESFQPWDMADDQALILAGGKIVVANLPPQWDVIAMLRRVAGDFVPSGKHDNAQYALGVYLQSRQQYTQALQTYRALLEATPDSELVKETNAQIDRILRPQVSLIDLGVQAPGQPAQLQLSYRNTDKIHFVARRINLEGLLRAIHNANIDQDKGHYHYNVLHNWHSGFVNGFDKNNWLHELIAPYLGEEVARWESPVADDGTHRYANAELTSPLDQRGAYLIYAHLKAPGNDLANRTGAQAMGLGDSRAVLAINDTAIVEKRTEDGNLYFISDAITGAPIPGADVQALHVWATYDKAKRRNQWHKKIYNLTTDDSGFALLKRDDAKHGQIHLIVTTDDQRIAWTGMSYWSRYHPSRMRSGDVAYIITDRPVYRPGQTVNYKAWLRTFTDGEPRNTIGQSVNVQIHDRKGNKLQDITLQTDQFGGIDGSITLEEEPPLGQYNIQLRINNRHVGSQAFRVEEYKKPEFEVTVAPADGKDHIKLGETVEATITAKYYFGSPVSDGDVSYKVFREEYTHSYYFPGPWDWLYGQGYGLPWYPSPWFEWWPRASRCFAPPQWWWWQGAPNPVRELVMEGEGRLDGDGTLTLSINTANALKNHGDRDHRYFVEAEVTDPSRRVITGQGAVTVTRQAYYTFVQPDRGWYRPGEEMTINIRALSPDNQPIETEGIVTITDVVFGGPDNAQIKQTQLERFTAKTDAEGNLTFKRRWEKSGQLRITFEAPDAWGETVEGFGLVWVVGRDFTGALHKFNDLELITDKRTYSPGETAHVMINAARPCSYVLFSDNVDNNHLVSYQLLHLPGRSMVIDVPITEKHKPNFFIEATTVSDLRLHQQQRRILVPPAEGVMDVTVTADKVNYLPGERATVKVKALTPEGEPAHAQVVLAGFDKSVLYIQPKYTQPIARVFHGMTRGHHMQSTTNLLERFSTWGYLNRPFQELYPLPDGWDGTWGPTMSDWRTITDEELNNIASGGASYFGGDMMETRAVAKSSVSMARGGAAMMDAAAPAPAASMAMEAQAANGDMRDEASSTAETFADTEVRSQFADTALWQAALVTDENGIAEISFNMPENLTTWQIDSWAMTPSTRVGEATTAAVTRKNLLVRLQAPRFFVERDEVVISANVHNDFDTDKTARVSITIDYDLMKLVGDTPQTIDVPVASHGQTRVDWRVKVTNEGLAKITIKALTDEESDAMSQSFPVLVHGMTKQVATTGSMRPDEMNKTLTVEIDVPEQRKPELTRLEVQFAPSLIGAMIDALPYCLDYPYGCTEQTMSRFLPAILTRKTIDNLGINLADIKKARGRLDEIRRIEEGENIKHFRRYADSPVFEDGKLDSIIKKSLKRLGEMQNGDGGWGWWSNDRSNAYFTSYVLYGLTEAVETDVDGVGDMLHRGFGFLKQHEVDEMHKEHWSVDTQHTFAAWVLSRNGDSVEIQPADDDKRPTLLNDRLYQGRDKLNLYGKALLALTLHNLGDTDRAKLVLQNIKQYKKENAETQLAWFETPSSGWWYWWNNDIETNAWVLRALVAIEPQSDVSPKLVKWLLNNRRNGYYWRSTRDTALVIASMSDFVNATGEADPDYTLTISYDDGAASKSIKINRANFFTYDNRFVLEGNTLTSGKHKLTITKEGKGALYFNTYLRYFTMEEPITKAGQELKVERTYFKLQRFDYEVEVETADGSTIKEKRLRYDRIALNEGDQLQSGDLVQVELRVTADNNYTYLAFEDPKPAGCEPTELRSGHEGQEGFATFMELRDEKVVFFMPSIEQGEHLLRHRLRAEVPGTFHALPTTVYGMYVPELRGNSDEYVMRIVE